MTKFNEIFIENNLPRPLKKEELYDCFKKMQLGDLKAREKIINHNIRLVIDVVVKKFLNTQYETRDLISIGLIGLIKSVDTFDINKGNYFSSYAIICIRNEILMFLRKRNNIEEVSLEQTIVMDDNKNDLKIEDVLMDDNSDFMTDYENKKIYESIRNIINALPEKDKNIVIKYFGFYGVEPMSQKDIAIELGISSSYVSRIIKRNVNDIKKELERLECIEISKKLVK